MTCTVVRTVVHFYNLVYYVDATVSWTLAFYKTEEKSLGGFFFPDTPFCDVYK